MENRKKLNICLNFFLILETNGFPLSLMNILGQGAFSVSFPLVKGCVAMGGSPLYRTALGETHSGYLSPGSWVEMGCLVQHIFL
jgi:hypothetical protein